MTIIDASVPGYYKGHRPGTGRDGSAPADVRALILTNGHSDHIGFAERLRRERRVPMSVHEADAALGRGRCRTGEGLRPGQAVELDSRPAAGALGTAVASVLSIWARIRSASRC